MTKTSQNFDQAYKKLNPAQKRAVDTLEGPVLVLAGPGTGKTQVLTTRIANILKETDTEPSSILALTFTEAATKEMRERLINLIGPDGYYVKISTFHGFCNDVIRDNPERFNRSAGLEQITDLQKVQIINKILEEGDFLLLKPSGDPLLYTHDLIGKISTLKREGFTLPRYTELVSIEKDNLEIQKEELTKGVLRDREKTLNKNLDLLDIYQKYQQALADQGLFDFDDMINWVVEAFETDPDFLLDYQEDFTYFLVDEYQDTNTSQNRLVFALSSHWGEQANVFVVGDPDQSIYRFQGASKENLLEFQKRFPSHTQITLDQNYRSTPTVLSASAVLLGHDPLKNNITLKDKPIKVAKFSSSIFEDKFIARSIKQKIKQGISPSDIAVIVRNNSDIDELLPALKQKKLPFKIAGDTNILKTPRINQFLNLLRVITQIQGPLTDLDLFTVLSYPYFEIRPHAILQASRTAYQNHQPLSDLLMHDHPEIDDHLVDVFHQLIDWNSEATKYTLPEMFQRIFSQSGLQNYLLALPQPLTELNRFVTLFDEVKSQAQTFPDLDLFGFVQNLEDMRKNNLKLNENILTTTEEAVTLTTAHKAKGLEWQVVYIYRFADGHWSNQRVNEKLKLLPGILNFEDVDKDEPKNAEERRLFYVALTRAKQQIYLTGAETYTHSTRMIFPALFYHELPKENLIKLKTQIYEKDTQKIILSNLTPTEDTTPKDQEANYLKEIIKDTRLSPTALNTYLQCPYKYKLNNLYKIPQVKGSPMSFGTAIHTALENLYLDLNNGKAVSKENFILDFETALKAEVLTDSDYRLRLARGREVLSAYFDYYHSSFKPSLFTEKDFGKSLSSQVLLDDIPLDGKVDRIDLLSKDDKTVKVIDYKTGNVKSRNEIEGKTKGADGGYKRQLVFYHLLANLDKSFPYHVTQSEIQFIEPNDSGYFKSEIFHIQKEGIEDLKNTIRETAKQIRDLKFPRTTNTKTCEDCPFINHCWPEGLRSANT